MTITKRNGKYYCRFQIDGERHHFLCNSAKDEKKARKIEQGFMYKVQQQQNGIIPKDKKRYKLKALKENFLEYSKLHRSVYTCTRTVDLRKKNTHFDLVESEPMKINFMLELLYGKCFNSIKRKIFSFR